MLITKEQVEEAARRVMTWIEYQIVYGLDFWNLSPELQTIVVLTNKLETILKEQELRC